MITKRLHYVRVGRKGRRAMANLRNKYGLGGTSGDEIIVKIALLHLEDWAKGVGIEDFSRHVGELT